MDGRIALVGGDEFRPGCEEMDRAILRATGVERPSLLVLPTAAADQNPSKAASNGVSYFASLGADASPLMALDGAHANDDELLAPVDEADVVYLTGGSPQRLLDVLRGSLLLEKLERALHRGAIVAGSSAGAMVMGEWMRFRGWRRALGVARGVATLPHHEGSDPDRVAQEMAASAPPGRGGPGHRRQDRMPGRAVGMGGAGRRRRNRVPGRQLAPLLRRRHAETRGVRQICGWKARRPWSPEADPASGGPRPFSSPGRARGSSSPT